MEAPDFYDDLGLSLGRAQRIIFDGANDRRAPAHHPVVASIDARGDPQQRVMILRHVDWDERRLRFHTDCRSAKVSEIADNPAVAVLIYDEDAKVQIRMSGTASIAENDLTDRAWHSSTPFARRCYMAETAPGSASDAPTSGLPEWIEGKQPDEAHIAPARTNFAALIVTIGAIEWLYLANSGHRRAKWYWDEAARGWSGRWLVP